MVERGQASEQNVDDIWSLKLTLHRCRRRSFMLFFQIAHKENNRQVQGTQLGNRNFTLFGAGSERFRDQT